jgi:hypothetical protein
LRGFAAGLSAKDMATSTQEIQRDAWRGYFDELTRVLGTVEATVEVVGRDVGDQIEAERQLLTDISYDDQGDVLVVGLEKPGDQPERVEHRIEHPQRVLVATGEPPPLEMTFDVVDGEQHQWLIRLERPPALPGE